MRREATATSCAASSRPRSTSGATTINLPDTVGYSTPDETREFFAEIIRRVPNADKAVFSAHCHDDLGLAVANSLAAISGGVRQVECTINGIGERAGNAALEEIVMALRVRKDRLPFDTAINSPLLFETSQLLARLANEPVQANKAIVGRNAFAHEAGIHQDGVLKDARTYEIMRPQDVGQQPEQLVLGRHSGRHAVQRRCDALDLDVTADEIELVYRAVITFGEHRKIVGDGDLRRIVERLRAEAAGAPTAPGRRQRRTSRRACGVRTRGVATAPCSLPNHQISQSRITQSLRSPD